MLGRLDAEQRRTLYELLQQATRDGDVDLTAADDDCGEPDATVT